MSGRKLPRGSSDPYYDLFEDWDLIISSFLSQYGIRIRTQEFTTVSWDEFKSLLAGIAPETALGRVVAIRAEKDKEVIKRFTRDQRRVYEDWRNRKADRMTPQAYAKEMAALEASFRNMCGQRQVKTHGG